jgi:ferredoxin
MTYYKFVIMAILLAGIYAFRPGGVSRALSHSRSRLHEIPLELEGQLDEKNKWTVKFIYNGEEKDVEVGEGDSILESAEKIFDYVESSCRNGVCTTCAGQVTAGIENTKTAVHGLGKPQVDAGFVCTCQCFPVGPGVTVKLGMNDECYESQYGQFEKSYEMKYGEKDADTPKKKGLFGF